ncbi:MAG: dTDP-glucose 4,6-dehydratase, partial [Armatimonadetes bacterium]|nr:dTDP-glucose 4,6-dehydratase [Candidatus Hippobium faecium]
IVNLDSLTYAGNLLNLKNINSDNYSFVKGDITDRKTVFDLFEKEKFDFAVNFAAETHVDRSILNPGIFLRTNILGVQNLLDACLNFGNVRFHQVSTDEVYGDLPLDKPEIKFDENFSLKASSPYSASKASADLLVLAYYRTYGIPVTVSRCSNNYGPYQFPEKLIPLMINNALNNEKLPVYGKGENVRDWLYVEDHCSAIDTILQNGKIGEVYNIGGNNEKRNIDIVLKILELLDKPSSLISYVTDRKGHDLRYAINAEKIQNELGWYPKTDFEFGMRNTVDWYLNNREWIEKTINGEYKSYYSKIYNSGVQ